MLMIIIMKMIMKMRFGKFEQTAKAAEPVSRGGSQPRVGANFVRPNITAISRNTGDQKSPLH